MVRNFAMLARLVQVGVAKYWYHPQFFPHCSEMRRFSKADGDVKKSVKELSTSDTGLSPRTKQG